MSDKRVYVISTKLTDDEYEQFMAIVKEEHFVGKSALLYMITADYLKMRQLEKEGRIVKKE